MALEAPHLLLVLLVLLVLVSGSWMQSLEADIEQREVEEALLVTCRYSHLRRPYQLRTWCRKKPNGCNMLVTTSKPRTLAQDNQYTIWDDPDSGFLNVTMAKLNNYDMGLYWCATFNVSSHIISQLRMVPVVVNPETQQYHGNSSTVCPQPSQDPGAHGHSPLSLRTQSDH
ncbi:PREDICTED: trem-like transcript 4 protein-like [Chrysochloris asiatica]|uniref:Trem-like transcript 4 protein-like n=1 Tax=Chrysochloris asiatica TaxID=185453 RepID=A0A9B0T9Y6_CHRAS|nr:PREDICTED: trem-like transcript 4 protein-like [Chrysochloris asiatica]